MHILARITEINTKLPFAIKTMILSTLCHRTHIGGNEALMIALECYAVSSVIQSKGYMSDTDIYYLIKVGGCVGRERQM